ncbi:CoxG family protein [Paraburkholderia sp. BCC1885]|uniref:CoxG family protein n=1 Tax=Paraburkholderia sp. BCC1885 TaxID=2562669 RepID=UPI001182FB50|nr:carbon monoxide dehydrogenase subunit G [Paraburkholderia sp. BCC1885]
MELTESYTLPVSQQRAWEALNDTAILGASIPGCERIEAEGANAFALSMAASVGPVKARFKGRMLLTDIDAPRTYTIVFEGQGGVAGFGSGNAHVTLEPGGAGTTKLTYTASVQMGGRLAQIGSRFVDGAASRLTGEFFRRFIAQVSGEDGAQAPAAPASGDAQTKRKKSWTAWISKS